MIIYLHVEIASRELDSKLLLAVIGASRGHQVLIADSGTIMSAVRKGHLEPGILHTKSLTPRDNKIASNQTLLDNGFLVTSLDEEGGLIDYGYEHFARTRYSSRTMEQAGAIFGWGFEDTHTLKRRFPDHAAKIHRTGSPRVDLWKPSFAEYWAVPKGSPKKPFLLVSANMGLANNMRPVHERIKLENSSGLVVDDLDRVVERLGATAEDFRKIAAFVEAIRHLATDNDDYEIVLRPHPTESIDAWVVFLDGMPNVHVLRNDSITPWVNSAFAVMHNSCTTAIEATISGTPVVSYLPFEQAYARDLPNDLGHRVESLIDLNRTVRALFENSQSKDPKGSVGPMPQAITTKIHLDDEELAAEKMMKAWERLAGDKLPHSGKWNKLQASLVFSELRSNTRLALSKILRGPPGPGRQNFKFPAMNSADIEERISRLQNVLGLSIKLDCKLLSGHAVLVSKSASRSKKKKNV